MSGALAIARRVGRFGQFGVTSGLLLGVSAGELAGDVGLSRVSQLRRKGGRFLDWSEPTRSPMPEISAFASRDDSGSMSSRSCCNQSRKDAVDGADRSRLVRRQGRARPRRTRTRGARTASSVPASVVTRGDDS